MTLFFKEQPQVNGIFNVGSGLARNWNDLVLSLFKALGKEPDIEYIDMPLEIRDQYQYFTEARTEKIRAAGFDQILHSLEEAVSDYVKNYLLKSNRLGES